MRIDRWIRVGVVVSSFCGALAGEISAASAGPVANLSRTAINFGYVPDGTKILQAVFVTNTGDAPLTISAMSFVGANTSDFVLGGTCGSPITLAVGDRCRLDISSALEPSGGSARSATLAIASNASPNAQAVDLVAYYAFEITQGIETTPPWLDFASQAVGIASPGQTVTTGSHENIPVTFDRVVLVGGHSTDFALSTDCAAGTRFVNGLATCTTTVNFTPTAPGPRSTELEFDFHGSGGPSDKLIYYYSVTGTVAGRATPVPAIEFYNASQDHFFITWIPNEIAILDAGVTIKGWTRTGYAFNTYSTAVAGTSPVCRFYIPPEKGDSHFYGRGTAECTATGAGHPDFVLEDPDFMNMFLPNAGSCPADTTEVFRVFDNRVDANHRYMTDRTVRDQMVARGWLAEGDGPDLVVMCAPK